MKVPPAFIIGPILTLSGCGKTDEQAPSNPADRSGSGELITPNMMISAGSDVFCPTSNLYDSTGVAITTLRVRGYQARIFKVYLECESTTVDVEFGLTKSEITCEQLNSAVSKCSVCKLTGIPGSVDDFGHELAGLSLTVTDQPILSSSKPKVYSGVLDDSIYLIRIGLDPKSSDTHIRLYTLFKFDKGAVTMFFDTNPDIPGAESLVFPRDVNDVEISKIYRNLESSRLKLIGYLEHDLAL